MLTLGLKLLDVSIGAIQKRRATQDALTVESIRVGSTDMQFLIVQLREEVERANKYFTAEREAHHKAEDELEESRNLLAVSREIERHVRSELMIARDERDRLKTERDEARVALDEIVKIGDCDNGATKNEDAPAGRV